MTIQLKVVEQHFAVVLFILLYQMVRTFESVDLLYFVFFCSALFPRVSKWRHVYQAERMHVRTRIFRLLLSVWSGEY